MIQRKEVEAKLMRASDLDNIQKNIVKMNNKNILVVACPGAGKTTVIVNRVNYIIESRGQGVGRIIVLTFTRAAAENMKNRYKEKFNKDIAPFFGTFHGLFYKMLLREGYKIEIIDGGKTHGIIKAVLARHFDEVSDDKIKDVLNCISMFKTSLNTNEEVKISVSVDIFQSCLEAYEDYKKKEMLWDFDDLSITILKLLNEDSNILNKYRNIFKTVLVDEFQDCDDIQIRFLKLINGEDNELFAVGDEDQCIYSFRGSKPQYMVKFKENFKDGKKVYLSKNYRSKKNIVEVSKKVILNNSTRNNKDIISNSNEDGIIRYLKPFDEYSQGNEIAKIIKDNLMYDYKENAVLYRTNMEVRSVIDCLSRNKIPFRLLDKGYDFFQHFICKDIINYLRLSINIYDRESFFSIINKPFRYVSKGNINYVRQYREEKDPFSILINKNDTAPFQAKKLEDLKKEIQYLNKMSLGSAIQYIISSLGYIDYVKEYSNKFNIKFDDLEDVIEEFKCSAEGYKTITEFLIHVKNVEDEIEKSSTVSDGVILSTIHGVKGMEFKNVFVINVTEETLPHKSSIEDNLEEERRLFYVAISRAIQNLYVFAPKSIRNKFYDPSRFIEEAGLESENQKIDYGIAIGDNIYHRAYKEGVVKGVEGDVLRVKFEDGIVRKLSMKISMENSLIMILK